MRDDPFPFHDVTQITALTGAGVQEVAMGPTLFIMAIMGCGDADAACRQVRVADATWATVEACEQATPAILSRNADLDYPVVSAQCRGARADQAAAIRASFPHG